MSNANVALVQGLYAAFGRGDVADIIAGLAPDVHWESGGRRSDFPTFGPRKGPSRGAGPSSARSRTTSISPSSRRASSVPPATRFSCSASTQPRCARRANRRPANGCTSSRCATARWCAFASSPTRRCSRRPTAADSRLAHATGGTHGERQHPTGAPLLRRGVQRAPPRRRRSAVLIRSQLPRSRQSLGREGAGGHEGRDRRLPSRRERRALGRARDAGIRRHRHHPLDRPRHAYRRPARHRADAARR